MSKRIDIVIPAAGMGRRMKSFGPKALVKIGGESLIRRQLRVLSKVFPAARFVVVAGFCYSRIASELAGEVKLVHNQNFAETNVAESLRLGLEATAPRRPTLVVYGDLLFGPEAVEAVPLSRSSVVLECGKDRSGEVGATWVDGRVTAFGYGLPWRWAQICSLAPDDKAMFVSHARRPESKRMFGYEVLARMLNFGFSPLALTKPNLSIVEIDTSADLSRARSTRELHEIPV